MDQTINHSGFVFMLLEGHPDHDPFEPGFRPLYIEHQRATAWYADDGRETERKGPDSIRCIITADKAIGGTTV